MSGFRKRALCCFVVTLLLMLVSGVRVLTVSTDNGLKEAADRQSTRKVDISAVRGRIYDCNGIPLTDRTYTEVTAVLPSSSAPYVLSEMLHGDELIKAVEKVRLGKTVTVWGNSPQTSGGWARFFVPTRYSGTLAHVIGYVDSENHGVTGVEKAFDNLLFSDNYMSVSYSADSTGRMLEGVDIKVDEGGAPNSVTLTIDARIQSLCEQAMSEVECGAAVIMEAETGKLKAVVSQPQFDPDNVAASLVSQNSPMINRATYCYNVGSVFKPCLAAAALENGLVHYRYTCTGSITVGDKTFKCNRTSGHGELGLKEALAYSCNTYFYTLGQTLGAEKVHSMAENFRFGREIDCGGGLVSSSGVLPALSTLQSIPAELTNLSIGQGGLMLSPIALCCMYASVINGGEYRLPYLVQSTETDDNVTRNSPSPPTVVFSAKTAEVLKEYLINTVQNGTGNSAFSEGVVAGGKTGTAQTGWIEDGRRVLNGWFCGFYEGKKDYVIVILKEDVQSGSTDCAPVFKVLTEGLKRFGF